MRNFLKRFAQTFAGAGHAALVPNREAEFAVERIDRPLALDGKQLVDTLAGLRLRLFKLGHVGADAPGFLGN